MLLYIISKNLIYFAFWILKHVLFLANWMYAFLQKYCCSEYPLYINNKRNVIHSYTCIYIYIYFFFCILFFVYYLETLKTGHVTFYKKWHSTDVTNYSNTHTIYKYIFRNIRGIHYLSMYFPKFQQISKIS